MRLILKIITTAVVGIVAGVAYADSPAWGDLGDGMFANPVLNADYSDPDIVRIGDKYYLTCSEFHFMGMPILESEDLVNWRIVGQIFDHIDLPGYSDMSKYAEGSWAPALKEHDGKVWMYVCTPEEGLFMSRADSPYGPWEPLHMVKGVAKWEDPCPFWDEDGQAYLVRSRHRAGPIIIHRMSADGRELLDEGVTVYEGPVAEGPKMFKKDGFYYISIPEGGVGEGWQTILRSKDIYGPYESKRVLEQGSTDINGPHQGSLVETPEGDWWFAHFQSAGARGRVMHLQTVRWVDGWPEIGEDFDGNGIGEPMHFVPMPTGKDGKAFTPHTSDEFEGDRLGIQWQFNHNPVKECIAVKDGFLWISPLKASRLRDARNQLTQKLMGYKSEAVTAIDWSDMKPGDRSGLLCIGKKFVGAGIEMSEDGPWLYMEEDSVVVFRQPLAGTAPDARAVRCGSNNPNVDSGLRTRHRACEVMDFLVRLEVDTRGNRYAYSYSVDGGKTFEPLGAPFEMRDGYWKGVRVGLYAYSLSSAPGLTRFDCFRYAHDGNIASIAPLEGAEWITVDSDQLPVYPDYLSVFRLGFRFDSPKGRPASLLFGLDDPRLMDRNMNIYGLANGMGESYIRLEVAGDSIRLFRSGYHPEDDPTKAIAEFKADNLIHKGDSIEIAVCYGNTEVFVNGKSVGRKMINPVAKGNGGDYIAFPVLGAVEVDIPKDSKAKISDVTVSNFREPKNPILRVKGEELRVKPADLKTKDSRLKTYTGMPEFRGVVRVDPNKTLKKATANATAMGIYDLYANGERVNEEYFLPGSTQYNKTHLYHTFDLTDRLKAGDNELRARVGEGWWCGPSTYVGENWNFFGDRPAFKAELTVEYTDGTTDRFVTAPETWQYSTDGPLVTGSFFQGEIYDARKEDMKGGHPDRRERTWQKAVKLPFAETVAPVEGGWDNVKMRPSFGDRVLAVDTLTAISMTEPRPGVYVYDLGQNTSAVPYLIFDGLRNGQEVTVRHGEVLYPDMPQYADNAGMVMTENLRAAMCIDKYIASGNGREVFSPRHTLHGYRYLELTGLDAPLPLEVVKSIPVSSVNGFKAHFECSDSLVNRLWDNIRWSTISNFVSIPTDCPQRNERLGWMGDISVYAPTATKIADVGPLLRQFMQSVRDCQADDGKFPDVAPTGFGFGGLLWGSAGITVPWECYLQYGDTALLAEHYPAMKKYIDYIFRETIEPESNVVVQNREWGDLGDWLSPEYDRGDKSLLWECYLIHDLEIMRDVAAKLGYAEDSANYAKSAEGRKRFFAETYVDPATQKTRWSAFDANRMGQIMDTQSSYALPIAMGIYDSPGFRENFVTSIERENRADDGTVCPPYSLMTGFIGTAWVMEALSKIDRNDVAYTLLTSTNYPSWLYPVTQGATSVWERLNSYTDKDGFGSNNSMNSFNHYSFGSVGNWLLTRCLGITWDEEGKVSVNPTPDPTGHIKWARGWIDTPEGRIEAKWGEI